MLRNLRIIQIIFGEEKLEKQNKLICGEKERCNVPLCPLEKPSNFRVWYIGEEICFWNEAPGWVKKQGKLQNLYMLKKRRKDSRLDLGFFTVDSLGKMKKIKRGTRGEKP